VGGQIVERKGGEAVEIDARPRRGGKTTAILGWLLDAPEGEVRVLVVPTGRLCDQVKESLQTALTYRPEKTGDWQVVTPGDLRGSLAGRFAGKRVVVGIDELDHCLEQLLGYEVRVATLTPTSMLEREVRGERLTPRGLPAPSRP
jgi:hypothetical protein